MANLYDKSSLVLIPSGTKTGKVFSQKPVSGDGDFTFTRASAATRVNADGNIEKETQNLLLYSNQPNQWSVVSVSLTGGQAGYDGSNDAWLFDSSAGYIRNNLSLSGVYTYSIYAKQGTANGIRLRMDAGTDANVYINLTDGSESFSPSGIDYTATSVGGGWWRISVTQNDSSFSNFRVYAIDASGGSTTGTIYIQDAQINQGLVAQPYQETIASAVYGGITDNTPRLDYTDSSCPALLLEPQRTNLFPHSEYFGDWAVSAGTLTANSAVSPEGLNNAYLFTEDTTTGYHRFVKNPGGTGSNKTFSVYAKWAGGTGRKWLTIDNGPVGYFDLENGVVGTAQGSTNISMEDAGNGWYRCIYHNPASTNGTMYIGCSSINGGAGNHLGNGQPAFYCYGAQSEDNSSYATSYIPTYGSSVSRVNESSQILNIQSVIGGLEGTIFFDIKTNKTLTSTNYKQFFYYSDSSSAQAYMYISGNNYIVGNPNLGNIVSGQKIQADTRYKIAVTYKANDFKLYINGSLSATRTSGNVIDAVDITSIGSYNGVSEFNEFKFNSYMHFQQVLSNEELAALTTI